MAIPRAFSFYMNELTNYSKNMLKLTSENTSDIGPGSVLRLKLPTNTIVNMRSLNFIFFGSTSGSKNSRIQNAESLIRKAEWSCGGVNLSGSNLYEYDLLYHMLLLINGGSGFRKTRSILQNDDQLGTKVPSSKDDKKMFCIDDWFGFPNLQPSYIDTSILPQIELTITFNDANCLALDDSTSTDHTFTLSKYYFTIETIQFNSPIYDEIMSAKLEAGEIIEIPYQDCTQTDTVNTGSIRFNVNSHCVSKLLATLRADNCKSALQSSIVNRTGKTNRYRMSLGANNQVTSATTLNEHATASTVFGDITGNHKYRWTINGSSYPPFDEEIALGYTHLLDSFGDSASRYCQTSIPLESDKKSIPLYTPKIGWANATLGSFICTSVATMSTVLITDCSMIYVDAQSTAETTTTPSIINLSPQDLYTNYNFILPLDLGLESDGNERIQTGYNSLGGNSMMTLELGGAGVAVTGSTVTIMALTQPKLRVAAGQMVEVIR